MEFYYHDVNEDVLVISADGGLNRQTSSQFTEDVLQLIDTGVRKILIDCQQLTYISSYGLAVLLRMHKRAAKAGGQVSMANVHSAVADLLNLTRLNRVFHIYPDTERALLGFRPKI
ncbi:MAG: STAS domain-containing protein [Planctomycetota bacterium]|jgi:anti-sigma B factor antagonist